MEHIDYLIIEDDDNNNNKDIMDDNRSNENNRKIEKKIKNNFEIYNSNLPKNNISNKNHHKVIEIKDNNDNSLNTNIRKINDYTFNISINNSNKNIFTENIPKNIQNLKTKNICGVVNNIPQNIKSKIMQNNENINMIEKSLNNHLNNNKNNNNNNINLNKSDEMFQLAKKIKYNDHHYNTNENNKEEIITYKISAITKNELQGISKNKSNNENDLGDFIKSIEMDNFKRVQRVINGKENTNNINYSKSNNSENININKESSLLISPIKKDNNNNVINKMDKKIHIKGRKNHNYISIINITNNAPIQKNEEKENEIYDDHKIYTKKIKGNFNTKKFLEENFLKDINENNKDNNNKNKSLTNITDDKSNNIDKDMELLKDNNNNDKINNNDVIGSNKISKKIKKVDLSKFLNKNKKIIINNNNENNINNKSKEIENSIDNTYNKDSNNNPNNVQENNSNINKLEKLTNNNNDNNNNNINNNLTPTKKDNNLNQKNNRKMNINDFFNNANATTLKITKSREIDINEIKNTKLSIINKRNFSKTLSNKNAIKENYKVINNHKDTKNVLSLNKSFSKNKKIKNKNSVSSFSFRTENNKFDMIKKEIILKDVPKLNESNLNNSFNNLTNISLRRGNSLNYDKKKNKNPHSNTYKHKIKKISKYKMNFSSSKNNKMIDKDKINIKNIISPTTVKKLKIMNIPISKKKKKRNDYNSNTYDANINRKRNLRTESNLHNSNNIIDNSDFILNDNKYHTNTNIHNTINADNSSLRQTLNNNFKHYEDKLNILTNGTKQSFCYYRVYNQNNIEVNVLEVNSHNFEIFGYSEGYIFLSLKSDILKFIPIIDIDNELWINLKSIIGIEIDQNMSNVIKIHSLFENGGEHKNLNINNLIQMKEYIEIPIEENEKIRAALCNNYSFNIIINDVNEVKIECIFNNFEIYTFWMDYLEKIKEYHKNFNIDNNNNICIDDYKSI